MTVTSGFFISHGSPTTLIDEKSAARPKWMQFLKNLPTPKAFLVISAHWETTELEVTASAAPELIYDFYGFPEELYNVQYPAIGDSHLAEKIAQLTGAKMNLDRGLDHGSWIPLKLMHPSADIPVLQLSLPKSLSPHGLFKIGENLSSLRHEGVMIIGSGALTHNLSKIAIGETTPDLWAQDFENWVIENLSTKQISYLLNSENQAPHYQMNHPADEHFRPLHILLGACNNDIPEILHRGFEHRNISMACFKFS